MRVSVIIPVYNRAAYLEAALRSVIAQTFDGWEVIVVDDGSSVEYAKEIERLVELDDRIRVVRQSNRGAGLARQHGFEESRGEFIQFLDSDDLLLPNKFEVQLKALEQNPECGIAYGITRLIDSGGAMLKEPYKWSAEEHTYLFPKLLVDRWWSTNTPIYRRAVCEASGPWPDMVMSEDWLMEARIAGRQIKLVHCPELVCEVRQHDGERLTGGPETEGRLRDRVRLLEGLWENAQLAGVDRHCAEMRHFSRWAFFTARQCGGFGEAGLARKAFQVAEQSAVQLQSDFRIFRILTRVVGWRGAARLAALVERCRGGTNQAGAETMKLSWTSTS